MGNKSSFRYFVLKTLFQALHLVVNTIFLKITVFQCTSTVITLYIFAVCMGMESYYRTGLFLAFCFSIISINTDYEKKNNTQHVMVFFAIIWFVSVLVRDVMITEH